MSLSLLHCDFFSRIHRFHSLVNVDIKSDTLETSYISTSSTAMTRQLPNPRRVLFKRRRSVDASCLARHCHRHFLVAHARSFVFTMDSNSVEKCYMSSPESTRTGSDLILSEVVSLEDGFDDELSAILEPNAVEDEVHRPLSPATPFESFFLSPDLQTSQISANALASQIRNAARGNFSGQSITSVATDEFGTACETHQEENSSLPEKSSWGNLFGKDVLIISREPIPEVSLEYEDASIMSSTTPTTDPSHFDVAEHVYEGAKGVWAWGKGIVVFKPFMGIAEGVSNKVLGIAGTSLQGLDNEITPKLADIDNSLLNPAIAKIVGVIMSTFSKGEDTLGPLVQTILNAVGVSKIEDKKTPEPAPELTSTSVTASGKMSYVK